ncbi:MAG: RNA degradosome polyphosphate kinase, partial [Candidatus Accumulibacter sp.]|uniref:RNA degradosome polyphosphate kinase n=1 Tax=Accumulibacter sp. TaxID=2053492 RepID=UPI001AFF586B
MTAPAEHPTIGEPAGTGPEIDGGPLRDITVAATAHTRMPRRAPNGRFIRMPGGFPSDTGLPDDRFLDREVSWLQFNERVLQLAADPDIPLLERARFLAIFSSNLDEFFMVRVAGLKRRIATGIAVRSASGLEPREVLEKVSSVSTDLLAAQSRIFHDHVRPDLEAEGISIVRWDQLSEPEHDRLADLFTANIFPVLTPLAVDPAHPFPYISGLSLNLAVVLVNPKTGKEHFARVKVPEMLPRLVQVEAGDEVTVDELFHTRFVPLEDLISAHLEQLFPGMDVVASFTFRVTRNEDLEVEEDDAENLLTALEKELTRRRFGPPVRLEVDETMDGHVLELLVRELGVHPSEVYQLPAPLDLRALPIIADVDRSDLHYSRFVPRTNAELAPTESAKPRDVFASIRKQDILLHHPYDSFSTSVQSFIEQAAADPQVLAIKQTLYRTSGDSPIIDALIDAAEAGKQVLALVEIKARFDEEANLKWARDLERAGVHVVFGFVEYKTHAKLSMVVRKEGDALRTYCHFGTGNYHPVTARIYTDLSFFTCDPALARDAARLFNYISGYAPPEELERISLSPINLKSRLLNHIDEEIEHAKAGRPAQIWGKVNSLVDPGIIDALYKASMAGVQIDLVVRGISCLRPGIPGLSENIRAKSIVGRFLEHSRIFCFGNGHGLPSDKALVYISSADMMPRNLDRRVETLVPLINRTVHEQVLSQIMLGNLLDNQPSYEILADGTSLRMEVQPSPETF